MGEGRCHLSGEGLECHFRESDLSGSEVKAPTEQGQVMEMTGAQQTREKQRLGSFYKEESLGYRSWGQGG